VGLPTQQHRRHELLNASLRQLLVVFSALSDLDLLTDFWTIGKGENSSYQSEPRFDAD
jgi:hypothetical protein